MRPDKNFRMSKPLKRRLALAKYPSKEIKDAWKKAMIGSELTAKTGEKFMFK